MERHALFMERHASVMSARIDVSRSVQVDWTFEDESTFSGETQPATGIGGNEVMLHGGGKRIWRNGDSYEGDFRFGLRDGQGAFTWGAGDRFRTHTLTHLSRIRLLMLGVHLTSENAPFVHRYEGGWKQGEMHGLGVLRQGGDSGIVWHEQGRLESFAPVAKLPVRIPFESLRSDACVSGGSPRFRRFLTQHSGRLRASTSTPSASSRGHPGAAGGERWGGCSRTRRTATWGCGAGLRTGPRTR